MANNFIQIPPDSTGKRIKHQERLAITVSGTSIDLNTLIDEETITGDTSGVTAKYTGFDIVESTTIIYVTSPTGNFTNGETLSSNDNASFTTVVSSIDLYVQNNVITDANVPSYGQRVDKNGSSQVRFRTGEMGFDAFGNAQFTQPNLISSFNMVYGDLGSSENYDYTLGGASITSSISDSSLLISVDNQSGSIAQRTSNQYFPYIPGIGREALFTGFVGDSGKSGNIRRMGFYDDDNGIYFMLSGSEFCVGLRTNTSGTVVDDVVKQSDFNGDRLETDNVDAFSFDLTKLNIYWIDYAWLGAGRVRLGTFDPGGNRIVVHTFENSNKNSAPFMRTGTLPIRVENINESSTSGTSEIKIVCANVSNQNGSFKDYFGPVLTYNVTQKIVSGSLVPLASTRPLTTYNGVSNRTTMIPLDIEAYVDGDPIRISQYINPTLSGSTWSDVVQANEFDSTSTSFTGGLRKESILFGSGVTQRELTESFQNAVVLNADGVTQPVVTLAAECMNPNGNATVDITFRWKLII